MAPCAASALSALLALALATGLAALGHLGVDDAAALVFDAHAENAYGAMGQWLLQSDAAADGQKDVVLFDGRAISTPWVAHLDCLDSEADLERLRPFITNSFRGARFHKRHCGSRPVRCGRVVLDGALDEDLLQEVRDFRNRLHLWEGTDVIRGLLERHFRTGTLVAVAGQLDHSIRAELPCEMHSDYLSRPPYYFLTAIVYLVDQGRECSRCETVFCDSVEEGRLSRGSVVQPKRGRVVLFSGGLENMHCKLPSVGRRDVVQLFFQCAVEDGPPLMDPGAH